MEVRDIQMSYTTENPKLVIDCWNPGEDNFTGVVKDYDGNIAYYENGKFHRIDGPAVMWLDGEKRWYIHGERHREDGPAIERAGYYKYWYYNDYYYGASDDFTVESWTKKWQLEIFK